MQYNLREIFQDVQESQQVVIIDEYQEAFLKYSQVNQMCDGTYQYPRKGSSAIRLNKPLIIIMSNKKISDVYKDPTLL